MLLVSYDISDDKLRTHFAKFLSKYGYRLQYSIFEISNSPKILENVKSEIENRFKKKFGQSDSVIIFQLSNSCKITRYGYARNDEEDCIMYYNKMIIANLSLYAIINLRKVFKLDENCL